MPTIGGPGPEGLAEAQRRLSTLYEISKLLTRVLSVEETVRAVFGQITHAIPVRSVVVVLPGQGPPLTIAQAAEGIDTALAEAHAKASYAYLLGYAPALERPVQAEDADAERSHLIVLPIVVETRPIFGVLQLESAARPGEQDLIFINAVVNQLANALEWRAIIEARQATSEAAAARAEVGQAAAERRLGRAQDLAIENALLFRKAEQASRDREEFLAIVSHDLRNQLNAILMSVTLLLRRRPKGDQERRATKNLVTIQRSALGMSRQIGDLLDVASIESGNLTLTLEPEGVGSLVKSALALLEEQVAARSLRLTSEVLGPEASVVCDRQRLHQVFANLIGNAIRFTQPGGAINVRAEAQDSTVRFAVSDTGAGILGVDVPHVFDRFWHGSRKAGAGTGLGMAIVKGIIEAHGGAIWLESQVGVGTTFYFTLPRGSSA